MRPMDLLFILTLFLLFVWLGFFFHVSVWLFSWLFCLWFLKQLYKQHQSRYYIECLTEEKNCTTDNTWVEAVKFDKYLVDEKGFWDELICNELQPFTEENRIKVCF